MRDDALDARARRIGAVNWLGLRTLYAREVRRFMKVAVQTVLAPVVQTLLFMAVLTLALGEGRSEVLGVAFPAFLGPGLIMMAILSNAFANSSSSIISAKMQGASVDFLMPPLSPAELTAAFIAGAATRGVVVGIAAACAVAAVEPLSASAVWALIYFPIAAGVMMGAAGTLAGMWADKFDHLAAVTNFVIVPLTFLSGTFYSISILPAPLAAVSQWNPFFHLIDGFRYGVLGVADGSIAVAAATGLVVNIVLVGAVYAAMRRGWRLKA